MTAPTPQQGFDAAMRAHLAAAGAAILVERSASREFGQIVSLWAIYAAAALMGVTAAMPGQLRLACFAFLALISFVLAARAIMRIGVPTHAARRARLERGSGAALGTFALHADSASAEMDALGERLWVRARADAALAKPRLGRPEWRPSLEVQYGLLPLLALALVLGLLLAKASAAERLSAAFSPYSQSLASVRANVTVEAPDYAGALPRRIEVGGGRTRSVTALAGSRIAVRLDGWTGSWRLLAPDGSEHLPVNGVAAMTLALGGDHVLKSGFRTLATVGVTLAADAVPVIRFDGNPTRTTAGALRIGYRLADDNGASSLSLQLRRGASTRLVDLQTTAAPGRGNVFADLTPHPFAGSTVDVVLVATDGARQSGSSAPLRITLPERRFSHPFAIRIAAQRKALLAGAPRAAVARGLSSLALDTKSYGADPAIFAGIRSATWRLVHDRRPRARESAAAVLWDVAADLDDGGSSRAMDDLRSAMERLAKGLGSKDDKALAAMADNLEAAMSEYLRRQIEAALEANGAPPRSSGEGAPVDIGFLDQMFADLKDRLAAGDTKGAAEALANLRQLMETLRFGSGAPDPAAPRQAAAAAAAAEKLRGIETRQRALRDQTVADMISASFGSNDALKSGAQVQADISEAVRALQREFGAAGIRAPNELGEARSAMNSARLALARGDALSAIRAENRALDALARAAAAADAAAAQMAAMAGGGTMQPGASGSGLDPLGRPGTGFGAGEVKIPETGQVRRIQMIRKILEERASDPSRSSEERGYYLRLLKRF